LLARWRARAWPVAHVRHASSEAGSPLSADAPGFAFMDFAAPAAGEPVYVKQVNSAFIGTRLEEDLRADGVRRLVVCGLTTDHCVSTSVRMAANLGFEVTLVADACATFARQTPDGAVIAAEEVQRVHLASLHGEFARVRQTAEVLALQA
jgi:nicotinamidase-related amidase